VRLPINPEQAAICDNGEADQLSNDELNAFAGRIVTALEEK
jgi:hypothetical protein